MQASGLQDGILMEWEAKDLFHRGASVGGSRACLTWGLAGPFVRWR